MAWVKNPCLIHGYFPSNIWLSSQMLWQILHLENQCKKHSGLDVLIKGTEIPIN